MKPSFDEMQAGAGTVRPHYSGFDRWLQQQPRELMAARRDEAEMIFRRVGITFAVYGAKDEDGAGTERLIPFVSAYVDTVDLAARRITVGTPQEGRVQDHRPAAVEHGGGGKQQGGHHEQAGEDQRQPHRRR